MHKVTNRTDAPYTLKTASGAKVLPAGGHIKAKFTPEYLAHLESFPAVSVERARGSRRTAKQGSETEDGQ